VFPVRYKLNSYINLLRNSVFKGLIYYEIEYLNIIFLSNKYITFTIRHFVFCDCMQGSAFFSLFSGNVQDSDAYTKQAYAILARLSFGTPTAVVNRFVEIYNFPY
jgi:hypothetical protein